MLASSNKTLYGSILAIARAIQEIQHLFYCSRLLLLLQAKSPCGIIVIYLIIIAIIIRIFIIFSSDCWNHHNAAGFLMFFIFSTLPYCYFSHSPLPIFSIGPLYFNHLPSFCYSYHNYFNLFLSRFSLIGPKPETSCSVDWPQHYGNSFFFHI